MESLRRFWRQPSTHYRNFQLVAASLTFVAVAFALLCFAVPGRVVETLEALNLWLGGRNFEVADARLRDWRHQVWRYVGAGWGVAIALSIRWLRRELRSRRAALVPIAVFFSAPGVIALGALPFSAAARVFLVLAVFVLSSSCALSVAAILAWSDISGRADGVLVPRPVGPTILGWSATETKWIEGILAASLPPGPADDQPGFGEVDLGDFWEEYLRKVPLHFRLGLRMATWVVTFWPLVTFRAVGTFHRLDEEGRDEVLRSIEHSRFFVVRQVSFVLKTTIGFGYFRTPEMQRRYPTAYGQSDGGGGEQGKAESGERKAESGKRRAEGGEQRKAESGGRRAEESGERRAEGGEQRKAESGERRAESGERRVGNRGK